MGGRTEPCVAHENCLVSPTIQSLTGMWTVLRNVVLQRMPDIDMWRNPMVVARMDFLRR